jgi:hypothetical protein
MRIGAVLFLLLVVASLFNAVMAIRARQQSARRDQTLYRLDAFLVVWAQTWGQPAEDVAARLRTVLRQFPVVERKK